MTNTIATKEARINKTVKATILKLANKKNEVITQVRKTRMQYFGTVSYYENSKGESIVIASRDKGVVILNY